MLCWPNDERLEFVERIGKSIREDSDSEYWNKVLDNFKHFVNNQENKNPEYNDIVNKNFLDLI